MYSQVADSTDHPMSPEKKPIRAAPIPSGTEDNLLNQTCWKSPTPSRHDKPQVSFMAAVDNKISAAVSDCTDSGSCTAVSAQRSSTPNPEIVQPSGSLQHVSPEPSEELAIRRQLDTSRPEQSHVGRPPHGEGGVWNQACGQELSGCLGRSVLGDVCDVTLLRESEAGTPSDHSVLRVDDRAPREAATASAVDSIVPKAKAKPLSAPRSVPVVQDQAHLPDMDPEWEENPEMFHHGYTNPSLDPNMLAMQTRMLNMENALTRVIHHLEAQAGEDRPAGTEELNTA